MPPRYAYWTIIVDEQATAFRAGAQEDLMPTFNRLKEKHPSAKMMWFQNGKLWPSRVDAQEAMRARGEMGRKRDARQSGGFRDRKSFSSPHAPRTPRPSSFERHEKPEWKPKSHTQSPKSQAPSPERPEWKPKGTFQDREAKPAWQPKGAASDRGSKPAWRPKGSTPDRRPTSRPRVDRRPGEKLEWTPKSDTPGPKSQAPAFAKAPAGKPSPEKRKWVPKEEYKKSRGIEAKKDKNWRPGGEHKDPRQKYKDAKKAKWTRFKQTVRKRWEGKPGKKKREE